MIRGEIVNIVVGLVLSAIVAPVFLLKYLYERRRNSAQGISRKDIVVFTVIESVVFMFGTIGAPAAEWFIESIHSSIHTSYLYEIDDEFREEFTLKEKSDCKDVINTSLLNEQNTINADEENYSGTAPKGTSPNTIKEFTDELEYWKNRCKNSYNPICYKIYASTACDYVKYLVNLDDYKTYKSTIKTYSEISIDHYRKYLKFNTVSKADRSDALYRIAQLSETLSTIHEESDNYRAKMLLLSIIYYELANECKTKDSVYRHSCLYYLAAAYERFSFNSKSKDSMEWLLCSTEYYLTSLRNGYRSNECKACLSRVYGILSDSVKKYEDEILNSQYKSSEYYLKLSDKYKV